MEQTESQPSAEIVELVKKNIIWGGIYVVDRSSGFDALVKRTATDWTTDYYDQGNNQKNHFFIPVFDGWKYYMVDTYMLGWNPSYFPFSESKPKIQAFLDGLCSFADADHGKRIMHSTAFAYHNYFVLTADSVKCFKLLCDLRDCEIIPNQDAFQYKSEDTWEGVKLYEEHNYPYGITLHRKNGPFDWPKYIRVFVVNNLQFNSPRVSSYEMDDLNKLLSRSGGDYDHAMVEQVVAKYEFLAKQEKEYSEFVHQLYKKYNTGNKEDGANEQKQEGKV